MRALIIPVAAIALALSAAGALAQTGGASGTSGGAAAKSGSDATAPTATTDPSAAMAKSKAKGKKKKKTKTMKSLPIRPPRRFSSAGGFLLATAPARAAGFRHRKAPQQTGSLCATICRSNTAALLGAVVWQATDGRPKRLSRAKVTSRERKLMRILQAVFLGR